ncbi:hypothetical protein MAL1_00024 [Bacteriophage DSS3_MAL1]|nr:hypothetical protein MAL1_00024 [Bacteriophage DSS3_MAL1]
MPYQINTTNTFIIDGVERNAGDRVYTRDFRVFGIDGVEIGSAAQRMYLKDHRLFCFEGQGINQDRARAKSTAFFTIEGNPTDPGIHGFSTYFTFDGIAGDQSIVAARETNYFIIDNVSQETPP